MRRSYTIKDKEIVLEVDLTTVAVRFAPGASYSSRATVLRENDRTESYRRAFEIPNEGITLIPVSGFLGNALGFRAFSETFERTDNVQKTSEVYRIDDKKLIATNRVIVGLANEKAAEKVFGEYNLQKIESFGENEHLLSFDLNEDPIELVSRLNDDSRVEYAEPDFVIVGQHRARSLPPTSLASYSNLHAHRRSNDPHLANQYAVFITEADSAWNITTGNPGVTIAILDEGVDTRHPDLLPAITGMYDAVDDDNWQEPMIWDAHGSACAGLAAAVGKNGRGIRGIGDGCSIFAVRIAYSPGSGAPWWTENSWIRRAIDWSWENGADILSNSWGGGHYNQSIVNAFERARTKGRGGLGSVVLIAAGNDSGAVSFPGYLNDVLTISASNQYDEFKTKTSGDKEHWWGSNFGPEVDLAAPGVANLTTDISGSDGYEDTDYCLFNGTSSATPIAAGACGLLLSAMPDLTEAQVREILCSSADKVGQFAYGAENRNDYMGYGRLNVRRALERALVT